jgi:hypothetical protein
VGSLVFVHGIGVRAREDGGQHPFDATCKAIRYELTLNQIERTLIPCNWGDDLGAKLLADGSSIPGLVGKLAVAALPDDPAGLWAALLDDPTFELRALAAMGATPAAAPPGHRPPWLEINAHLAGLKASGLLEQRLERLDLHPAFERAVHEVRADPATAIALQHPQAARAIGRAVVARMMRIALEEGIPLPPMIELEKIATGTEQLLREGQLAGIGDWAKEVIMAWATSWGDRRRATLTSAATPTAGDVLLYQAHGEVIRTRIREIAAEAPQPVAVLAHSLGGIAAVETLCEDAALRTRVTKLVTAGSQSGLFYELDVLRKLPFGTPLAPDFPEWLNFWDPRDFLSFLVEPVFNGGRARRDVEVNSGLPFPASHSGYWRQSTTWDEIKSFLAN